MIFIDWLSTAILHSRYVRSRSRKILWVGNRNRIFYFQLCSPGAHHAAVHDFNLFVFKIFLFVPDTYSIEHKHTLSAQRKLVITDTNVL